MSLNINKENVNFGENILQSSADQSIDTQINLPDYCPDIQKVLKCFVVPNIFACQIAGDRATADGEVVIRILYVGDGEKISCYEQIVPFSKYVELSDVSSDCTLSVSARCEYVNCRAMSQRRVSVGGNITLHFGVSCIKSVPLVVPQEDCSVETKGEVIDCDILVGECEKMFEMSETAMVSEDKPPIACIVKSSAYAQIDSVKCIANKMLIKGDMIISLSYCSDSSDGELVTLKHVMPISQIIEIQGIDENSNCLVKIDVCSVSPVPKTDSNGETRLVDLVIKAVASVKVYENREVNIVTDSYSTECEIISECKNIDLVRLIFTYKENKQVRQSFDAASLNIAEVIDSFVIKTDGSALNNDGKIDGKGEVIVGVLFKDTKGELGYTERTVEFSFECQSKQTDNRISAQPSFCVTEVTSSGVGADKLEIKLGVFVFMPLYEVIKKRVCTEIELNEDRRKPQNKSALTIYFSSAGEKLWDIARHYNTTVKKIKEENDLTGDEVSEKMMLMIPN